MSVVPVSVDSDDWRPAIHHVPATICADSTDSSGPASVVAVICVPSQCSIVVSGTSHVTSVLDV